MTLRFRGWVAVMSVWLWTLAAEAQTALGQRAPAFEDSMNKGLVPLFFYVAGAIAVMTIAAGVTIVLVRRSQPVSLRGT